MAPAPPFDEHRRPFEIFFIIMVTFSAAE